MNNNFRLFIILLLFIVVSAELYVTIRGGLTTTVDYGLVLVEGLALTYLILLFWWSVKDALIDDTGNNNVLDSPDIMEILYQPLTRIVHCRDDDPESKVRYHHIEIFECNYELEIPIGTIVCEGHFNYQITGYNPFCNGKGRVYRTKRL